MIRSLNREIKLSVFIMFYNLFMPARHPYITKHFYTALHCDGVKKDQKFKERC